MGKVTLRPAAESDRLLIKNIFNLYQNDLSAYTSHFTVLDSEGYFCADASDDVLPFGDGIYPYIIEENAAPVGFILVTDGRNALEGCDFCFQELYLVRPARGRGIAKAAAEALLRPGRWCLSAYAANLPARKFWEKLIAAHSGGFQTSPGEDGMVDYWFTIN